MLSGVIVDGFSYQWLFWLALVVVVGALVATMLWCPSRRSAAPARIDWLGGVVLRGRPRRRCCSAISEGRRSGWGSPAMLGLFAVAWRCSLSPGSWWERARAEPLVDMTMMRAAAVCDHQPDRLPRRLRHVRSFILIPQFVQAPSRPATGSAPRSPRPGSSCCPPRRSCWSRGRSPAGSGPLRLAAAADPRRRWSPSPSSSSPPPTRRLGDLHRERHPRPRHRLRLRLDGEPDRRGRARDPDRRRHRHEHDHAHDRRLAGRPDLRPGSSARACSRRPASRPRAVSPRPSRSPRSRWRSPCWSPSRSRAGSALPTPIWPSPAPAERTRFSVRFPSGAATTFVSPMEASERQQLRPDADARRGGHRAGARRPARDRGD